MNSDSVRDRLLDVAAMFGGMEISARATGDDKLAEFCRRCVDVFLKYREEVPQR